MMDLVCLIPCRRALHKAGILKSHLRVALVIIFFQTTVYGQSLEQSQDNVLIHKNIFKRTIGLEIINDVTFLPGLLTNDRGYTVGVFLYGKIPRIAKNQYFNISISSQLYTKTTGSGYKNASGLTIDPQYFTEISFLNLSINQYNPNKRLFFCVQVGLGIYNQQEPIPGLALYLQGGMDGKQGFHAFLGQNHVRQENIPTGNISPNLYTQFSVKKFHFFNKKQHVDATYLSLEPGVRLVFPFVYGSLFFIKTSFMMPIVRVKSTHKIKFRMAFLYHNDFSAHLNGFLWTPELGFEIDLSFFKIGYTNIFLLGQQQDSYIRYSDSDTMMRFYTQVTF